MRVSINSGSLKFIIRSLTSLRDVVPSFPFERKISKIETLRLALRFELLVNF